MGIKAKDNREIGYRDRATEASPMEKVTIKTLRDQFAMVILENLHIPDLAGHDLNRVAKQVYALADAMIEERSKEQ